MYICNEYQISVSTRQQRKSKKHSFEQSNTEYSINPFPLTSIPKEPYQKYLHENVGKSQSSRMLFLTVTPRRIVECSVSDRPPPNRTSVLPKIASAGSQKAGCPALHPATRVQVPVRERRSPRRSIERQFLFILYFLWFLSYCSPSRERGRDRAGPPLPLFSLSLIDSFHRGPSFF